VLLKLKCLDSNLMHHYSWCYHFWYGYSAASVSDCQNYLLLEISESCKPVNKLYYYDMRSHGSEGFTGNNYMTSGW